MALMAGVEPTASTFARWRSSIELHEQKSISGRDRTFTFHVRSMELFQLSYGNRKWNEVEGSNLLTSNPLFNVDGLEGRGGNTSLMYGIVRVLIWSVSLVPFPKSSGLAKNHHRCLYVDSSF